MISRKSSNLVKFSPLPLASLDFQSKSHLLYSPQYLYFSIRGSNYTPHLVYSYSWTSRPRPTLLRSRCLLLPVSVTFPYFPLSHTPRRGCKFTASSQSLNCKSYLDISISSTLSSSFPPLSLPFKKHILISESRVKTHLWGLCSPISPSGCLTLRAQRSLVALWSASRVAVSKTGPYFLN